MLTGVAVRLQNVSQLLRCTRYAAVQRGRREDGQNRAACSCWAGLASLSTDRKSTRLNSSHLGISYAVFCLEGAHGDLHSFPTRRSSDLYAAVQRGRREDGQNRAACSCWAGLASLS